VVLILVYFCISRHEPVLLFEGISAVPGIMLRTQVALPGLLFIFLAIVVQRIYVQRAREEAGLDRSRGAVTERVDDSPGSDPQPRRLMLRKHIVSWVKSLRRDSSEQHRHDFDFPDYCPSGAGACNTAASDQEDDHETFDESWNRYRRSRRAMPALVRESTLAAIGVGLFIIFGDLDNADPYVSGDNARRLLWLATYAGLFCVLLAVIHSLSEFSALKRWIVHLTYREPLLAGNARVRRGVSGPGSNLLGLLRIVGYISQMGYRAMLVPIILLFLYALSYARLFEGWPWPGALTLLLVLCALALFFAALSLLQAATAMRRRYLMKAQYCALSGDGVNAGALEAAILGVSQGVFRPTWQNPTIRLVLVQIALATILWLAAGVYV